jgi:hypothetical protein
MDVRINNLESNLHFSDARAMLTPEVLAQIVEAVIVRLHEEAQQTQSRDRDMQIDRRAAELDPWPK